MCVGGVRSPGLKRFHLNKQAGLLCAVLTHSEEVMAQWPLVFSNSAKAKTGGSTCMIPKKISDMVSALSRKSSVFWHQSSLFYVALMPTGLFSKCKTEFLVWFLCFTNFVIAQRWRYLLAMTADGQDSSFLTLRRSEEDWRDENLNTSRAKDILGRRERLIDCVTPRTMNISTSSHERSPMWLSRQTAFVVRSS